MKKFFIVLFVLGTYMVNAQAFKGKGDIKFQIGANLQQDGAGIMGSLDIGAGENFSLGLASGYLLGVKKVRNADGEKVAIADFKDRFDFRVRFNAHLGNVVKIDEKFDFYPGLYASLKNFGGHLGARYFFAPGFGVFSELNIPIAKYDTTVFTTPEKLNNRVSVNVGAVFNVGPN